MPAAVTFDKRRVGADGVKSSRVSFCGQAGHRRSRPHRLATAYSRADKCASAGETVKLLTEDILAVSQLDRLAFFFF